MRDREDQDPPELEFWFDFASPYAYIAAERLAAWPAATRPTIRWRPFMLGPIFAAGRADGQPFQLLGPAARRHKWRDLERLTLDLGIPWVRPGSYPRNGLRAARLALLAAERGFAEDFVLAVFRANFAGDRDIADPAELARILRDIGEEPAPLLDAAGSAEVKGALIAAGEEAVGLGIFGAPSFVTEGGELFWGQDRLDQAIRWAWRGTSPAQASRDSSAVR